MAPQIVLHTFRMIFGNFGQALRVSIGPFVLLIVVAIGLAASVGFPLDPANAAIEDFSNMSPAVGFLPIILIPLMLFVFGWVAVSWHRFILLEEYAGILPQVKDRPIWRYVGKSIGLALLIAIIAIPLFAILGPLAGRDIADAVGDATAVAVGSVPEIPFGVQMKWLIINMIVTIPLTYLSLRWGIALVGTALGKPLGFVEAWGKSQSVAGVLFGIVILLLLINLVPQLVSLALAGVPALQMVIDVAMTWLSMMLGISILTTLYGHVIEERPLVS